MTSDLALTWHRFDAWVAAAMLLACGCLGLAVWASRHGQSATDGWRRGLALLALLLLPACGGVSPVVRQSLDRLEQSGAHSAEREAVLRRLVGQAWRLLAEMEAREGLREDAADDLTTDEAMARLRAALQAIDRGDAILDGYKAEADAQALAEGRLRAAMAGALREMEERSAATEQLGDALEAAAGAAGQIQATRERRKAAEAEARRLEAERAAEEEE